MVDVRDDAPVRSPALRGLIRRTFGVPECVMIERAFQLALREGGESEIGFVREEGVSYNPRPARVAQVLVSDGGVVDAEVIATAVLAASDLSTDAIRSAGFPEGVVHLFEVVRIRDDLPGAAIAIRLATMLDFARHLHLLRQSEDVPEVEEFWGELNSVIESGRELFPRLVQLLEMWRLRHERRNVDR